jgi:putative transposase
MMSDYRRCRVPGGTYFFTVNLLNRRSTLLTDHIDLLRCAFGAIRARHPFHIDAIVVLPEHLHAVCTLPPDDDDYATRLAEIKKHFSRGLPATENRSRSRRRRGERGIWQRRFWEHSIRDDDDFTRHVNYVHYNPVKHGLCARPIDWPFSSLHTYIRRGLLPSDWGTQAAPPDLGIE